MLNKQDKNYTSTQETTKSKICDSLKKNDFFEQNWSPKEENQINFGDNANTDCSKPFPFQVSIEEIENMSLSGLEINFDKELLISKENSTSTNRVYHEIPKFLIPYSELYQNQTIQHENLGKTPVSKVNNAFLPANSTCWSNSIEQGYAEVSTDKLFRGKNEGVLTEEDDGILDVLSHTLSKSYFDEELTSHVNTSQEPYKYNFANNIPSSAALSPHNLVTPSIPNGCTQKVPETGFSPGPHVLGIRLFKFSAPNKRQISNFQLSSYDVMSLCSQFGNVIEINTTNEAHYVTYETKTSLDRALNSLQNLQISPEGDFIHAYIHQTSNTAIGGIERSMGFVQNQWSQEFSPVNFPDVKNICNPMNLNESIGFLPKTTTSASSSCRSNSTNNISGASTTTNNTSNSPWNSFNNSITSYERSLWTAWLQDNKNNQSTSNSKNEVGEHPDSSSPQNLKNNVSVDDQVCSEDSKNIPNFGHDTQNNSNKGNLGSNNNKSNAITYSSIVGSNLNRTDVKNTTHFEFNGNNCTGTSSSPDNSIIINSVVQDSSAFKPTRATGKLNEVDSELVEVSFGNDGCSVSLPAVNASTQSPVSTSSSSPSSMSAAASPQNSSMMKKYTARYEIQIPPDDQFQIARRIIGTRGINMKRIFKLTQSKLRLRGKGSGYLEGYNKQEADEPLHLCISSTNSEQYINARKLVERLLLKIYQEYDDFLMSNNENHRALNLQLKYKETTRTKQLTESDSGTSADKIQTSKTNDQDNHSNETVS
ncbi:RRM domain and KH domain protein [Cryptosporidium felis]|nr:RRM domain and KH domain protein [Cryptosporidium felis]